MIRYRFPLLIATWATCLSFSSSNVHSLRPNLVLASSQQLEGEVSHNTLIQAQAPKEEEKEQQEAKPKLLQLGDQGEEVKKLQNQLQELGYLETEPDGEYNLKTKSAIALFQEKEGLNNDGVAGAVTQELIIKAVAQKKAEEKQDSQSEEAPSKSRFTKRSLLIIVAGLLLAGGLLGGALMLLRLRKASLEDWEEETEQEEEVEAFLSQENHNLPSSNGNAENHSLPNPVSQKILQVRTPSPLAKVDRIEELIKDLQESDRVKRRQAIWELAQKGDSRAVKPLSNLIIDSDSQQCGLILEALSQISTRTLKPVNRALAISLQDENPEVRKNAIRDLTKVYDMVNQVNRLLQMACDDPDPEVQETARWAAQKFGKSPIISGDQDLPKFNSSIDSIDALERRLEE